MNIETVATIGTMLTANEQPAKAAAQAPAAGFARWLTEEIGQLNATMIDAESDVRQLAVGGAPSLHGVMIRMEEAKLSFQLLAQVRTRLLEAYQEIMRTQI